MRFKRSIGITLDCSGEVFKYLLYRIVTGLVFYSLIYLILKSGLTFIIKSEEFAAFGDLIRHFFAALSDALSKGDPMPLQEFRTAFLSAVSAFTHLLLNHIDTIVWSVIGVIVMYILQRFVNGLAQFAIASTVNDRMNTYSRTRFAVSFFKNVGKAALYQLVYVPISFLYDALSLGACWVLFFYIPSLLPGYGTLSVLLAVTLTSTAILGLQALKLTIVSAWMPAMIADGKSLPAAIGNFSLVKKDFLARFGGYFAACYLIVFVNIGLAVTTVFSGLLFTVPLSFIFLLVMQLVNYYQSTGKKYFIEKNLIIGDEGGMSE